MSKDVFVPHSKILATLGIMRDLRDNIQAVGEPVNSLRVLGYIVADAKSTVTSLVKRTGMDDKEVIELIASLVERNHVSPHFDQLTDPGIYVANMSGHEMINIVFGNTPAGPSSSLYD